MLRIVTGALLVTLLLSAGLVACSAGNPDPGQPIGSASEVDLVAMMAVSDLAVGENRLAFGLFQPDGVEINTASVEAVTYFLGRETPERRESYRTEYQTMTTELPHQHPDGELHLHLDNRGVYVIPGVNFDTAGLWGLALQVNQGEPASPLSANLTFQVNEESSTPALGMPAPTSQSPVAESDADLAAICSRNPPDDMHSLSIDEALTGGLPFVVAFATPSYCQSRLCGPVTDLVFELQESYRQRVNFIHIEPFELDIVREEGRLQLTSVAAEWGLPTEPWVFVVDGDGIIRAKFEGMFSSDELEGAIQAIIAES